MRDDHPRPKTTPIAAGVYELQALLFGFEDVPARLYRRYTSAHRPDYDPERDAILAAPGDVISFESYFNSFYASYWRRHSAVERLGVHLRFTGQILLRVVAIGPRGRRVLTEVTLSDDGSGETVWLPDEKPRALRVDRIYLVVRAVSAASLESAAFVTDTPPQRDVRLSLGLCTFNNEARLATTIRRLAEARTRLPEIKLVTVINQGDELSDPELRADLATLGVTPVAQRNLGGAGGFARTMAMATAPGVEVTHHLLMDDDILIDPAMIRRAIDFLAYTRSDEIAIGGSMLSLNRPYELNEAGAQIGLNWTIHANGRGLDLRQRDALHHFNGLHDVEYNAWWFFIAPTAAIRDLGMPYPMFLHGDDIEFGLRLTDAGVETVALPGVAVWHEDILGKPRDWIAYYDVRNALINAALYPDRSPLHDPLFVLGILFGQLLSHRYATTAALRLAVRDYLAGPAAALGADSQAQYERLRASIARVPAPVAIEVDPEQAPPHGSVVAPPTAVPMIIFGFVIRFFEIALPHRARPLVSIPQEQVHPCNIGPGPYASRAPHDETLLTVYKPNRVWLWRGMIANFWTALLFARRYRRLAQEWKTGAEPFRSPAHWERIFAASDAASDAGARPPEPARR